MANPFHPIPCDIRRLVVQFYASGNADDYAAAYRRTPSRRAAFSVELRKEIIELRKVKLYVLSTCGWCRKTKRFLDNHNVEYEYEYVDLLSGNEKVRALAEVEQYNPRKSFPTVVVQNNETQVVIGFKESRLREVLGL